MAVFVNVEDGFQEEKNLYKSPESSLYEKSTWTPLQSSSSISPSSCFNLVLSEHVRPPASEPPPPSVHSTE